MFNLVFTGFDFRDSCLHSKSKKTQSLQIKELATLPTNTKPFLPLSFCIVQNQDARKDYVINLVAFPFHKSNAEH